jgi:hypothetical protein
VEDKKIRRLGWAGHIIRIVEDRIPKKVLNGTFHNTRPVGRPRTGWADMVQRDALQLLGVTGWRRRASNRDEWRYALTFRNPASYIKDGHTATRNTPHFLYFFNKYRYRIF